MGKLTATAAPQLLRVLTIAYAVEPRKGEMLKLEWPDEDMQRKEFTLRKTKNGETWVIPMTSDVFDTFIALRKERCLDTPRVFLYNEKLLENSRTAFAAASRRAGVGTRANRCTVGIMRSRRKTTTRPPKSFRGIQLTP